jgi:DNA-binding MarR family transcriptional regulator
MLTLDLTNYNIVTNLYPEEMQIELKAELKGRSVLVLIELAFQGPSKSTIGHISKITNIPQPTLSKEIKKLINLGYVKHHTSSNSLNDTRFKYFNLTTKGLTFLHILKESLSYTLMHISPNQIE